MLRCAHICSLATTYMWSVPTYIVCNIYMQDPAYVRTTYIVSIVTYMCNAYMLIVQHICVLKSDVYLHNIYLYVGTYMLLYLPTYMWNHC